MLPVSQYVVGFCVWLHLRQISHTEQVHFERYFVYSIRILSIRVMIAPYDPFWDNFRFNPTVIIILRKTLAQFLCVNIVLWFVVFLWDSYQRWCNLTNLCRSLKLRFRTSFVTRQAAPVSTRPPMRVDFGNGYQNTCWSLWLRRRLRLQKCRSRSPTQVENWLLDNWVCGHCRFECVFCSSSVRLLLVFCDRNSASRSSWKVSFQ